MQVAVQPTPARGAALPGGRGRACPGHPRL